jgi:hypothetical protein
MLLHRTEAIAMRTVYQTDVGIHRFNVELDFHVHSCTLWLSPRNPPRPPPYLGSLHESTIGKPRKTTSLCDPVLQFQAKDMTFDAHLQLMA